MKKEYPFIYIGHGLGTYKKDLSLGICFENILSDSDKEWIQNTAPEPINSFFMWTKNILYFGSNEYLEMHVRKTYNAEFANYLKTLVELNIEAEDLYEDDYIEPDDDFDDIEPTLEEWIEFENDIEKWIKAVNENYPVSFFIKPKGEHGNDYTDWHYYSVEQIPDIVLKKINEYYENPIEQANEENEEYESIIFSSFVNLIFSSYFSDRYENELSKENAYKFISVVLKIFGHDDNVDMFYLEVLCDLLECLNKKEQINIAKSLSDNSLFMLFAVRHVISIRLFYEIMGEEPLEELKELIKEVTKETKSDLLFEIGRNIANVSFDTGEDKDDMIVNEDSRPLLGAKIIELSFDYPDCSKYHYTYATRLYYTKDMYEEALRISKLQFDKYPVDPRAITVSLYSALELKDMEYVKKLIDISLRQESIINDPYPLSNIIFGLNRMETKEASDVAITLTKNYWNKKEKKMIGTLYINMMDTFIVAKTMDNVFDDIVNVSLSELFENPKKYNPVIYENIACYFAMKDDKENVVQYLDKAKKYSHPYFRDLKELDFFKAYKKDESFLSLFD